MPIYTYRCLSCDPDREWDVEQEAGAKEPPCPTCKKKSRRVMPKVSIVYKGGGFTNAQKDFHR